MVNSLKWAAVDNLKKRKTESCDNKKWIRSSKGEEVSEKASAEVSVAHPGSSSSVS